MKENDFLRKKWRATGHDKISEFIRDVKSDLTQETWGAVMNRDKRPDLRTLMIMCAEMNCSPEEMQGLLRTRGEAKVALWVAPTTVTSEETKIIEGYRALDGKKKKLVVNLINQLRG